MLAQMPARLLAEWMAFYQVENLEPWGEERADLRSGIVASVIANVNRDPKKRRKPYSPEDFMPKPRQKERRTGTQMLKIVEMLNVAFGGRDLRKRE